MSDEGSEKDLDSSQALLNVVKLRPKEPSEPLAESDSEILDAVKRGDHRSALALCARRHGPSIGRLCMALLGSQSEADDALQDTLVAAHGSFSGFRGDGSLRAWLFSIARRRCARALERRGAVSPAAPGDDPASGKLADELLDVRRRAEATRALLARIRPTEREALLLRYEAELSFREVGLACGVDEAAARKRVSRALARLRELMKEK